MVVHCSNGVPFLHFDTFYDPSTFGAQARGLQSELMKFLSLWNLLIFLNFFLQILISGIFYTFFQYVAKLL